MLISFALALSLVGAEAKAAPELLPWLHDDWAAAKAAALKSNKLIAVDVWATWCHSCLSMKNLTLRESPLGKVAPTHVWLSLDYDQPKNAAFFAKFPVTSFPTFFVVDPREDSVVSRWVGTGTADQMAEFFANARASSGDVLATAHRALIKNDPEKAEALLRPRVAEKHPPAEQSRLLNTWIEALSKLDPKRCAAEGLAHLDEADDSDQGLDMIAMVADCAGSAEPAMKTQILKKVSERMERVLKSPEAQKLSVDDRSGLYATLSDAYQGLGDKARETETFKLRAAMLDQAAAAAKTPAERAIFDTHRMECDLALGRFAEAEAMLAASEKAFPKDYNPPARLAYVYLKQKRIEEGLKAIDRALALGYGPRRMRLYTIKIDLLREKNDDDAAKKTIGEARAMIRALDPALVRPEWEKKLDQQWAELNK